MSQSTLHFYSLYSLLYSHFYFTSSYSTGSLFCLLTKDSSFTHMKPASAGISPYSYSFQYSDIINTLYITKVKLLPYVVKRDLGNVCGSGGIFNVSIMWECGISFQRRPFLTPVRRFFCAYWARSSVSSRGARRVGDRTPFSYPSTIIKIILILTLLCIYIQIIFLIPSECMVYNMPGFTEPVQVTILWILCLVERCRIHSGVDIKLCICTPLLSW